MDLHKLYDNRVFAILGIILIILLVLFYTLINRTKSIEQLPNIQTPNNTGAATEIKSQPLPKTVFSGFTLNSGLPELPPTFKSYTFIESFTQNDALALAGKIGFKKPVVKDGVKLILITDETENSKSLLSVNKSNGVMLLVTNSGFPTQTTGTDYTGAAQAFLQKLGIFGDTLAAGAAYKRSSAPGIVYVEFHRDWNRLGLPFLNPVGVLNLDETVRLSDLSLGYVEKNIPPDPDVVWTSDNNTGKQRPTNFNTITVAVSETDNQIVTVNSNIKVIAQSRQKNSSQDLKTPQEAYSELQAGKVSFSLVKPTGEGNIDPDTVFPTNLVGAKNTTVTDVLLTYLDDVSEEQKVLAPFYLFRGTAVLESGYHVQFVQTVSAMKQPDTLGVFAQKADPTVYPGQGSTLQYGTFSWPNVTPSVTPNSVDCSLITHLFRLPNGGYIAWYPTYEPRNWFYIPPPGETLTLAELDEVDDEYRALTTAACNLSKRDPTVCAAPSNFSANNCMFIASVTPVLYFYSDHSVKMNVLLPKTLTYTDPPAAQGGYWEFSTGTNNQLIFAGNRVRNNLYYEYEKESLQQIFGTLRNKSAGFILSKQELPDLISSLSDKFGLNKNEAEGLTSELTRAAGQVNSKMLKVGIMDREIIEKYLPIGISPQPGSMTRIHFFITSAGADEKLTLPQIEKIPRQKGLHGVEIGAISF